MITATGDAWPTKDDIKDLDVLRKHRDDVEILLRVILGPDESTRFATQLNQKEHIWSRNGFRVAIWERLQKVLKEEL